MKDLSSFDINCVKIMTHLLANDVVEDDVIDTLHDLKLEYYSLLDKNELLEEKINIDPKTNLLKYKEDYLCLIVKTASRVLEKPMKKFDYMVSYIRFDIDDFTIINNKYGHDMGDVILIDIANIISNGSRPTDYCIRFGGEEIDVMLPGTELEGTLVYLDKIYKKIRSLKYKHNNENISVTLSAGVGIYSVDFNNLKDIKDKEVIDNYKSLQKQADNALYDAKLSGKDQYKIFSKNKDYKSIRDQYSSRSMAAKKK